jgi:hypothetical protein
MISMTKVRLLCDPANSRKRIAGKRWLVALLWLGMAQYAVAQLPPVHYEHAGAMPPGAIGSRQLERGGPLPGYFQPVEIRAPEGARISLAISGAFEQPETGAVTVGMLIGSVYRLRVTNIPLHTGLEVYPTIEVIDRLYPPVGQERRFPIPIELSQEELQLAIEGRFVTRVIYLEEPLDALPVAEDPRQQSYFEAAPGDNPLEVADRLGRPMAILRLGARVPDSEGPDEAFLYGSPPIFRFRAITPIERPTVLPPHREPTQQLPPPVPPSAPGDDGPDFETRAPRSRPARAASNRPAAISTANRPLVSPANPLRTAVTTP